MTDELMNLQMPGSDPLVEDVFIFPSSFAQQRLWFLDQLQPDSAFYNIPAAVRLKGNLELTVLERCLTEIIHRHETLRTTFSSEDGQPVQVIHPGGIAPIDIIDLEHLPLQVREEEVQRLADNEARLPFNLAVGPLLRVRLLRLDPEDHVVLITMHHIISDGWSMGVLVRELAGLYAAFSVGKPSPFPDLPIQYVDYAMWQRDRIKDDGLRAQLDYWKKQLSGEPPILKLPSDRPRPAVQSFRGSTCSINLPSSLVSGLKNFCRDQDVTLYMALLALFDVLIYRYTGQEDIWIGSPIANRTSSETEALIGFFVNTLVIRANLGGEPTFRELVQQIKAITLDAYANQDLPFDSLVEALQPERNLSLNPLFQVMFILQNMPPGSYSMPGLSMTSIEAETGTSTFDLTLSISELPNGLNAAIEYNTDLFDRDTVEQILSRYHILLEGILGEPDQPISLLPLLTPAEKHRILVDWNDTARNYPQAGMTVQQLFSERVKQNPDAPAVIVYPSESTSDPLMITYQELEIRSNKLANYLHGIGISPDIPVGLILERSLEMVIGVLGVLKAGGAYLPLDPTYPTERLGYMLNDSLVPILLTQERLVAGLPANSATIVCLDRDWPLIDQKSSAGPVDITGPDNLAYLIYTSGSTGQPKGVLVAQRNLVNAYLAWEESYKLEEVHSHLQMANFAFDVFSGDLVRALCSGAKLVLCPREFLLSPSDLYHLMCKENVDCAEFVPAVLRSLVDFLEEQSKNLAFMRLLICGSDVWYVEEFRRIQRLCGPNTRLINSFGLTEATIDSSYFDQCEINLPPDSVVPIGRPFGNTRMYMLDRHMQCLPPLVPGELFVGGSGVARGYLNRPELTAEKFVPDPFTSDTTARLYKTGDLARFLKDGQIEFLGRLDYQVKIRGFRVEIGEIESVLQKHPAIRAAVVIAASPKRGSNRSSKGDQALVAYLVTDLTVDRVPIQATCLVKPIFSDRLDSNSELELNVTDLSEGGMRLENAPQDWPMGTRLTMELKLPEGGQGLQLEGYISWQAGHSVGITFVESPSIRHQLIHILREIRAQTPEMIGTLVQDLRREHSRIPLHAACQIRYDGTASSSAWVENISRGGVRLVSKENQWIKGQCLDLEISLPRSEDRLSIPGVVWWVRGDWAGIRFDLADSDKIGIDRVVDGLIQSNEFSFSQIRSYLKTRLPDQMIPAAFVLIDSLPLTPNNKVDRKALPEPDWSHLDIQEHYIPPRTPIEETLAAIWSQILGVEKIGIEDNFFDLGGHSLLATQVVSRIQNAFQVELPLRRIFEAPTIAALALDIETSRRIEAGVQAPPIRPAQRDQAIPLSFSQQRLWFLDQLEPNSPFYNIPESMQLTGRLNVSVLERALNEVIRRHEIMRTTFHTVDGKPVQVIDPELKINLSVENLEHLNVADRMAEVNRLAIEEAQKPFNLAHGPLFRVRVLRTGAEDHVVLLTLHHIIGDDWSSSILVQEIGTLYASFSAGRSSPLPALAIQYADFAAWQVDYLSGSILDHHIAYWKQQLAGIPPLLELPTDRPRPSVQTFRGAYKTFTLSPELSKNLNELAKREGASIFMTLLAAFQVLLSRYSGQEDICVGTPIANRNRADIENLIGFFVNTLVLRADLSGEPGFRTLLKQVRESCLGAYAHQDLPFEKIVDILQPERNLSHSPLFQVMFVIQNTPRRAQQLPGLMIKPIEVHSGTAKFDLTLFMLEEGSSLSGALEYNTDLFDSETIERLLSHFRHLLESIVNDPDCPISKLPLLDSAERHQLLEEWNNTKTPFPSERCTHHLIEDQVKGTPNAIAVTFLRDSLSYAELDQRANQLAHFLIGQGVHPDICVGLCLERSLEMMVGLLGILKSGGAYVPLDPHYPSDRLEYMLQDSGVPVLLTQQKLLAHLPQTSARVICLDSDWEEIAAMPNKSPTTAVDPLNLAYVIYTSGSTGRPKGAMIVHRGLVNYLTWCCQAYPLESGQGTPVHSSISFDLTVTSLFPALLTGRTVHMLPEELGVEALGEFLRLQKNNSLIKITPAHLKIIGEQIPASEAADCTHAFIIGGENLLVDHIDFWQKNAPDTQLVNEYGPTETVVGCCVYWAPPGKQQSGVIPIGRPIINTRLYVLDRYLQPVPIGVRGELYIGGVGVARGYLNRPDLTAERFLPDPFSPDPGSTMYKTGDLVRWLPDGNLECLGRIDFQVKIRGFRVELGEVESVLCLHPGVKEGVVWVREDGGVRRLVAYFVSQDPDAVPSAADLREFLQSRLPEYMVPFAYVHLEELPLTPNGKCDRKALPPPESTSMAVISHKTAPANRAEEAMVLIWREVLRLGELGVEDNFFELGGDSILTIQVVSRARIAGLNISPRLMFEHPTIRGLVQAAQGESAVQVDQGLVEGEVILTPIQRWFFDQNLTNPGHWNQSVLLRLPNKIDSELLKEALSTLLTHHDALRLRFYHSEGDVWHAEHNRMSESVPVTCIDLSHIPESEQDAQMQTICEEIQRSLDLERGQLIHMGAIWLGESRGARLLIVVHHLAIDAVSWRILLDDLLMIFEQVRNGRTPILPPKTTSFKDWAATLETVAHSQIVLDELPYWLDASKEVARLPVDWPGGLNNEADTAVVVTRLDQASTSRLLQSASSAYHCDVQALLVTALARGLAIWSGIEIWQIELEGHGREDIGDTVDVSRTVGWFTNQYPLRIHAVANENPTETVHRIKDALQQLPRHGLGYGLLRTFHPDPEIRQKLAEENLNEISFNYLGQLDAALGEGPFSLDGGSRGSERCPLSQRTSIWDITGGIIGGELQLDWTFSQGLHQRATVEKAAGEFLRALNEIIERSNALDAKALTTMDLNELGWDETDVEDILHEIDRSIRSEPGN